MTADCHHCGRIVTDGYELCTLCADVLHRELLTVPGLVLDLIITRSRLDKLSRGRVGGKSSKTALPVRLNRFDEPSTRGPLNRLTLVVGTWARVAADHTGHADDLEAALDSRGLRQLVHNHRAGRRDPAAVSAEGAYDVELVAVWLACCAGDLRAIPDAGTMHDEITDALASVRRTVDRRPELAYRGQCSAIVPNEDGASGQCGADLYAEDGDGYLTCRACGASHEVRTLVRDALGAVEQRLFTIAELERVTRELGEPIPAGTMRSWHSRGHLKPRAWRQADGSESTFWMRRSDPPLFRLRDVRTLRGHAEVADPA